MWMDLCRSSSLDQVIHFSHCWKPRQPLKVTEEIALKRKTQLTGKLKVLAWKRKLNWLENFFENLFSFKQFSIGNISKRLTPEASNIHSAHLCAIHKDLPQYLKDLLPLDFPGFLTETTAALHTPSSAVGGSSCLPCSGWSWSCRLVLWLLQWSAWTRLRYPACEHRRPRWSWGKSHIIAMNSINDFWPVSFFCKPLENPCEVITSVQGLFLPGKDSCQCFTG